MKEAPVISDRSILIWSTKDFERKGHHKSTRAKIEFDHATKVKWHPDGRALFAHKALENSLEVYSVGKKPDGTPGNIEPSFPFQKKHQSDIVHLAVAVNGKFAVSCSSKTDVLVWNLNGDVLATFDTYHLNTYCLAISPCCRFVGTSGFTPDVKVFKVGYSRSGEFEKVSKAFDLKGHNSGVYAIAFNTDASLAVTVCKDGSWKVFNTAVEFEKGQDPYLLLTEKYEATEHPACVAISPDSRVIVIASGTTVGFYSTKNGHSERTIRKAHSEPITAVLFDSMGKFLLTTGDKHVRVFHNVTGYKLALQDLEEKKKTATTTAMKERLTQQMGEAQKSIKAILKEK